MKRKKRHLVEFRWDFLVFRPLSGLGFFQSMAHEAGEKCQNHLWIHFHQIVRQSVHPGTDLTSQ